MDRIKTRHRVLGTRLFLLYLAALVYFLFFAESLGRDAGSEYHYNLVLFREIRRFWMYRDKLGWNAFLLNTAGNVAAFLPFGFFLPFVLGRRHVFPEVLLLGILFSASVETLQLITRLGSFDVDDILLNVIGAVLGHLIFRIFNRRLRSV